MPEETLRVNDQKLDVFGAFYRKHCGYNDVLLDERRRPIPFDKFLIMTGAAQVPGVHRRRFNTCLRS